MPIKLVGTIFSGRTGSKDGHVGDGHATGQRAAHKSVRSMAAARATLWMGTDKDQKVRKASDSPMPKEGPPAVLVRLEEKDKLGR